MKRALILGGSGFVGRYLAAELERRGWETERTSTRGGAAEGGCVHTLDITDEAAVRELLAARRPRWIFHLAAQSSAARSWQEPGLTVDVNIRGAVNVLEAARALPDAPRLLLVGSAEEYGAVDHADGLLTETTPARPGNVYALTKLCQESLGLLYARAYGMDVLATRSFNHIGPGQSAGFVVSDFCRQIAAIERGEQERVLRVGNLAARRDFTDVRDVVRAYALLMEKGERGVVYNVGSGCAVAVEEILHKLLALSCVPIAVERDEARFRPLDVPVQQADISRLRGCTGWTPEIPLEQTLRETLEHWRKQV